jgi:hypothetical protein
MSDIEYLLTVKKLDELFEKKEETKNNEPLIDNDDIEVKTIDNSSEIKKNKCVKKKKVNDREDDLFQEIYGKFNGNYSELVEDYVQILIKFENKRIRRAYFFGLLFCIVSLSLVGFFSNLIPI